MKAAPSYIVTNHGKPLASFPTLGAAEHHATPLALKTGARVRIHDTRRNLELMPVFDHTWHKGRYVRRWVGPTEAVA